MKADDDDWWWRWEFLSTFNLKSKKNKYMMRRLGKYSGGVTHVTLTMPTYLVRHIEAWSSSKSLMITLIVEAYFRTVRQLDDGHPDLVRLLANLLAMDTYVELIKKENLEGIEVDRRIRSFRTYLRKVLRKNNRHIDKMCGFEVGSAMVRDNVREPHVVKRDDRRRKTSGESAAELGKEGYPDDEDKKELYRTNRSLFKEIFPELYAEWRAQDENKAEDDRQDPTAAEEDGDDPPEDPVTN